MKRKLVINLNVDYQRPAELRNKKFFKETAFGLKGLMISFYCPTWNRIPTNRIRKNNLRESTDYKRFQIHHGVLNKLTQFTYSKWH
ncbi:CLUMA_CG003713, isoform A [Clunio marinus]|uniref:CLUMA_CG003713, isoform A n=1 Tax=Clunio marinus TaxID=568069 RepID=A0A1J1HR19_9DIPT|nr:CLUMA_CG003713, isoform A [Clunio marinus]